MESLSDILFLILAGFIGGFINTLASSGSAVTLPLLIFLGLPANIANGTNRVATFAGSLAASITFQKKKLIDWKNVSKMAIPILIGAVVGSWIASMLSADSMGIFITVAVIISFIMIISNPKRLLKESLSTEYRFNTLNYFLLFLIGVWAGFIVLDSATYLLLILVLGIKYDLIKANALKNLMLFFVCTISLVVFAFQGEVAWQQGIIAAIGSIGGSVIGGLMASKEWAKVWILRILLIIVSAEIIQLLFKYRIL